MRPRQPKVPTSRPLARIRWLFGGLLGLMALRGAVDDFLGVAQWSGAVWESTSSLPVWIFLGVGGLFLLTVDLWLPVLLRHSTGQTIQEGVPLPRARQPEGEMEAIRRIRETFERAENKKCDLVSAEFVAMIEEGSALKGNAFGAEAAPSDEMLAWRESVVTFVGFALGDPERQRLLEVKPTGPDIEGTIDAILDWLRQRRDDPSWEARVKGLDGPELDAAIEARRGQQPDSLADQLDALMHEGIDLVGELSVPVRPEQTNGVWKVSGSDAPQEWIDKAVAFQQRCRDVLEAQHPALLADFRDGHMKHFQMEREANERREQSPSADRRSDGEKMLALANHERSGPKREVEACLEGLSVARKSI